MNKLAKNVFSFFNTEYRPYQHLLQIPFSNWQCMKVFKLKIRQQIAYRLVGQCIADTTKKMVKAIKSQFNFNILPKRKEPKKLKMKKAILHSFQIRLFCVYQKTFWWIWGNIHGEIFILYHADCAQMQRSDFIFYLEARFVKRIRSCWQFLSWLLSIWSFFSDWSCGFC